jgi:ribosomal protein L12E/L44/L45/RPP1/RPP2
MATELGGSVFEITRDLIGDLFRAKNAGVTPSVIKNLGATFCNIDPDNLIVDKLSKARNKKAAAPGGKKQAKGKSKTNPDVPNDDSQATNKKKAKKN